MILDGDFPRLGSVLFVSSSALTLLDGWQEGHPSHSKTFATYTPRLSLGTNEHRKSMGKQANSDSLGKRLSKQRQ